MTLHIGRLTAQVGVVGKEGLATSGFSFLWDKICKVLEGTVNRSTTYVAMTGPSSDAVVYDTTTITTPQLAARLKALEDRMTGLG